MFQGIFTFWSLDPYQPEIINTVHDTPLFPPIQVSLFHVKASICGIYIYIHIYIYILNYILYHYIFIY